MANTTTKAQAVNASPIVAHGETQSKRTFLGDKRTWKNKPDCALWMKGNTSSTTTTSASTTSTTTTEEEVTSRYNNAKRMFEKAYREEGTHGAATGKTGLALARVIARGVDKTVNDPQARKAYHNDNVSNSGCNPRVAESLKSIALDFDTVDKYVDNISAAQHQAPKTTNFGREIIPGQWKTVTDDKSAREASKTSPTIGEGMDLVNEAFMYLLEVAKKYANAGDWLDDTITVDRVKSAVVPYGQEHETEEEEVTPIQLVYRMARKYIDGAGATMASATSRYTYVSLDEIEEGYNQLYYRSDMYADIAGYPRKGGMHTSTVEVASGDITTMEKIHDFTTSDKANLTKREKQVFKFALQGKGVTRIAALLGVRRESIYSIRNSIMQKWNVYTAGKLVPYGWIETLAKGKAAPNAVEQFTLAGVPVAAYESVTKASAVTGIAKASIAQAANPDNKRRLTAGGYKWKFVDDDTSRDNLPSKWLDVCGTKKRAAAWNERDKGGTVYTIKKAKKGVKGQEEQKEEKAPTKRASYGATFAPKVLVVAALPRLAAGKPWNSYKAVMRKW